MTDDRRPALESYRAKRSPGRTPEPFGSARRSGLARGGLFVVQKHAARRTHWDLRLEVDGVLKSWAVPKGPSLDPAEKRLAVQTEDHPFEYGDFEGVIPEGNYGAGAMIVWDRGVWVPDADPAEGLEKGKLLFDLHGYKLSGQWTLFRTRPPANRRRGTPEEERQWLLMKKPDAAARSDGDPLPEGSVLSGLSVEELAEGAPRIEALVEEAAELVAERRRLDPGDVDPMLATTGERPFSRRGWLFELKYDGYRLLAGVRDGRSALRYRNGHDATALFPELTRTLDHLPVRSALLDGEVVVLGEDGRPSFQRLQKRALLTRPLDVERAALMHPATLFVFDLLALDDHDLRPQPLHRRKQLLRRLLPASGPLRFCDHVEERGSELFEQIEKMELEGMVAKDAESPYVGRRSRGWIKFRVERSGDFVVVGFTRPEGNRTGFGALHVAAVDPDGEGLIYAGRVGSGFDEARLASLAERLHGSIRDRPACRGDLPRGRQHVWVEPELVVEVRYREHTEQGLLRQPVFRRLRTDRSPDELLDPGRPLGPAAEPPPPALRDEEPELRLTNLDKVFWPREGYTKGDLIDYYRSVAPSILPFLHDRPVVLTRYPDGIDGKSFFQKNAPDFAPDWIRTVSIWSEGSEREIEYFVCNDERTLLYLANLGTIVLHVWSSRLDELERPDWCILDLDPKDAPFGHVVTLARAIHTLGREIGLPTFVKTSGSTGLHVLLPLGRRFDYEQSRTLGQLIAELLVRRHPELATTARSLERREGKVYVDWVQNGHGRLIVAPYSVRPLPGAPVSTPLRWREVTERLGPTDHDLRSVPGRVKRQRSDPLAGVLEEPDDLIGALERLSQLI